MNGFVYDALLALAERAILGRLRARLLESLDGAIVEVGAGTGIDFSYFAKSASVIAFGPDPAMAARAKKRVRLARATITLQIASDEALDTLPPQSVDVVVFPLVLCTIPDPYRTLERAKRVLRPCGRLAILEHVRGAGLRAHVQDVITPAWGALTGGCHPNRDTRDILERAGFDTCDLASQHLCGPSPIADLLWGYARQRP